ncbi:bacteriocin immunity protein [Marinobacter sp. 71-i]|uniref:Bacteriocin immunity protein n=1 Tax=Marinobacter iranensis TaxID=2962607 RepID=A0ABT5Y9B6_9GAMM|nr:bacteriocin immunity protein [Marinobacter iranensis]MDF0750161.1 bacteriocin immunity protein [Marinobacter iranensis]
MQRKDQFSEYTESEFLDLLVDIVEANGSEEYQDQLLEHFIQVTGHPLGSDLIYYPENPADATPERILEIVKGWRTRNGLPGLLS